MAAIFSSMEPNEVRTSEEIDVDESVTEGQRGKSGETRTQNQGMILLTIIQIKGSRWHVIQQDLKIFHIQIKFQGCLLNSVNVYFRFPEKKTKTAESGPNRNWIHPSIQINLIEKWFIIRPWLKSLEKIKLWKKKYENWNES